jgi:PAS domain S-box-containing protein
MYPAQLFHWVDQHREKLRIFVAFILIVLVGSVSLLVYFTGGVKFAYSHFMYIPILLAGFVFGVRGGVLVGLLGGVFLGPFMPLSVRTGEIQDMANWLYRTGFFTLIGLLSGVASNSVWAYTKSRRDDLSLIYNNLTEIVFSISIEPDKCFRFVSVNHSFLDTTGLTESQIIGKRVDEIIPEPALTIVLQNYNRAIQTKQRVQWEEVSLYPAGTKIGDVSIVPVLDNQGNCTQLIGLVHDITERKQAEERQRKSESKYRELVEHANSVILHWTRDGRITFINEYGQRFFGYSDDELIGQHVVSTIVPLVDSEGRDLAQLMERICADPAAFEHNINENLRRNGERVWVAWTNKVLMDKQGQVSEILSIGSDITGLKKTEESLRASQNLLMSVVENIPIRVFWKDVEARYLGCNTAFARDAGLPGPGDLVGKDDYQMGWCEQADLYRADDRLVMDSGKPKLGYEEPQTTPDGRTIWLSTSKVPLYDAAGNTMGILGIYEDITERKAAATELLRLNRVLKTLVEGNHSMLHARDEPELLQNICDVITTSSDYVLAWIGFAQHDENRSLPLMAVSGRGKEYIGDAQITWDDRHPNGHGPTGSSILTGQTQVVQDIQNDPRMEPWREIIARFGYASSIALPLKVGGSIIGSLTIYAAERNVFSASEVSLLEEIAGDLSFGIESLRARLERDRSLEDALQAIAATLEMRDLYTAGHQRRVADLAAAIAREIGLPEEQIHGIHLAGIVHDIGKISVPAEILTKPARLSSLEFGIIQTHPQKGYDILKDIKFPWPIAQIVLQHHEKLDGSGYPQGLRGEQILLESRIMTIADITEAMSSHRPYRPGLGVNAALEEVEKHRGTFYDPLVDCNV